VSDLPGAELVLPSTEHMLRLRRSSAWRVVGEVAAIAAIGAIWYVSWVAAVVLAVPATMIALMHFGLLGEDAIPAPALGPRRCSARIATTRLRGRSISWSPRRRSSATRCRCGSCA
jgi:hypothetical protein